MKVLRSWLQEYFDESLPDTGELVRLFNRHSYEVEGVEELNGDTVIDIDVLPNRSSDSLCHRGVARELSAVLELSIKHDPLQKEVHLTPESSELSVTLADEKKCRRYSGAVIRGVNVGPSPEWLQGRLAALGQKSINNIVDAANYVMFDLGQPLHAFDAEKLEVHDGKREIAVRPAERGEQITTLDGGEYTLDESHLVIADGNSKAVLGIAGIKGGTKAEVGEKTTDIILESANFDPTTTRLTSQKLKLRTDASTRFENEPPEELAGIALARVAELILKIAGGTLEGYVDEYPRSRQALYRLGVSTESANHILGTDMSDDDVADILSRLGFAHECIEDPLRRLVHIADSLKGTPYSYGASVSYDAPRKFDCSSFAAYCFSQVGVSIPRMAVDQFAFGEPVEEDDLQPGDVVFSDNGSAKARHATVEFMPGTPLEKGVSHCGIYLGDGLVIHAGGMDTEGSVMVETLGESKYFKNIVGFRRMLEAGARFVVDIPFERLDLRRPVDLVEEVGRIYGYDEIEATPLSSPTVEPIINKRRAYAELIRDTLIARGFSEVHTPSFTKAGEVTVQNALASDKSALRADLAGNISEALDFNERYADLLALDEVRIFELGTVFPSLESERMHLALGVRVPKGKGREAKADAAVSAALEALSVALGTDIKEGPENGIAEVDFDSLIANLPDPQVFHGELYQPKTERFSAISAYPFVLRDIAVWVKNDTSDNELLELIKSEAGELLATYKLFDEYKKDDHTSYAYRLVFQSHTKTLSDEEVNEIMDNVQKAVEKRGWEVR